MTTPRFVRLHLLGLMFAGPAFGTGAPVVLPGGELAFPSPDGVLAEGTPSTGPFQSAVMATGSMFGSHLVATWPLDRGTCEIGRENVFTLDGTCFDSVLSAHVSGRVNLNGFLSLVGMGHVRADVRVEVIDRDPYRLIHSHSLLWRRVVQELEPSVSMGVEVDAGSATLVQGGIGLGAGVSIPIRTEVLRESLAFGFDVPLRRGRTYILRVRCVTEVKLGVTGGHAGASFLGGFDVPPNLISPDAWLGQLHLPIKSLAIPDVSTGSLGITKLFDFPQLTVPERVPMLGGETLFPGMSIPVPTVLFSTHDVLNRLGFPLSATDLATHKLFGIDAAFKTEELISGAGMSVPDLAIQIQEDPHEQEVRLALHGNLARADKTPIADFQLPQEHGGYLELARAVVADVMARMAAAGESMSATHGALLAGDQKKQEGDFKAAYTLYRKAYEYATR